MRTKGVVDTEVETTVDDDTDDRGHEATVETGNTVRGKRLLVDIDETVELTGSSTLGGLGVVRETRTSVVEGKYNIFGNLSIYSYTPASALAGVDMRLEPGAIRYLFIY